MLRRFENLKIGAGLVRVLFDARPWGLALACALLLAVLAQFPQPYAFRVGIERGPESDLPFLSSFYGPEGVWPDAMFRWSRTEFAQLHLPAQGRRAVIVDITILSHRAQHVSQAEATMLTLQTPKAGAQPQFALRREGARYLVYLPPEALPRGELMLQFVTPSWHNEGDSRDELGIALAKQVRIWPTRSAGFIFPDINLLWSMPFALLVLWLALAVLGFRAEQAGWMLALVALGWPWLLLLDTPRAGFVGLWMPLFAGILLGAAIVVLLLVPPLLGRLELMPPAAILRWLLLLMALTFALKYAGRWFPDAMPGDWQLHVNRFTATVMGELSIQARHRGLPFPFPTGYYVLIAPLILSMVNVATLLPILAALWESLSLLVLYVLVVRVLPVARLGLLAAAIYGLTAAGFMNTWFSFHTQISTQMFTALLMLTLVWAWPQYSRPGVWWLLVMLLSQMFLGHIGTFINAGLLGVLMVFWLWRGAASRQERRSTLALAGAGIVATLFALLCFYTLFAGLIVEQISGVASGGLLEVSGKKALTADVHLRSLWHDGLITHYGFFPVVLALPGALALSRRLLGSVLPKLVWTTFAVSALLGLLPFVTQSAIMTRWLTFAAWAVAVAGAVGLAQLWRCGRAARLVTFAMAGYVIWVTAVVWVEALTQRLPPVEPF